MNGSENENCARRSFLATVSNHARFAAIAAQGEQPIPSFDDQARPTVRDRYWKVLGWSLRGAAPEEAQALVLAACYPVSAAKK